MRHVVFERQTGSTIRRRLLTIANTINKSRKLVTLVLISKIILLLVVVKSFERQNKDELIDGTFGLLGKLVKKARNDWSPGGIVKRFTLRVYDRNEFPSQNVSGNSINVHLFAYSNCISKESECVVTQPLPRHISEANLNVCCHTEDDVVCDRLKQNGTVADSKRLSLLWAAFLKDPDLQFIDIGANVGLLSLFAASMGKRVLAVEPLGKNLDPFCHSALLNRYTNSIRIVRAAVSNARRTLVMEVPKGAYNKARILNNKRNSKERPEDVSEKHISTTRVRSILIDDLLEVVNFNNAIMKINIQGHEPAAFMNASQLFAAVYIPIVIMEWYNMQAQLVEGSKDPYSVTDFFYSRNYSAYAEIPGAQLLLSNAHKWGDDVFWIHEAFLHSLDQTEAVTRN